MNKIEIEIAISRLLYHGIIYDAGDGTYAMVPDKLIFGYDATARGDRTRARHAKRQRVINTWHRCAPQEAQ